MSRPETAALDPELEALGRLVAEARPRPRAAWASELDARVAAGFRREPAGAGSRLGALRRAGAVAGAALHRLRSSGLLLPGLAAAACLAVCAVVAVPVLVGPGRGGGGPPAGRELAQPRG